MSQQDLYAANPDPRESALERIGESDLKKLLEPLSVEVASARDDGSDLFSPTGREFWHELAWGLLVSVDSGVGPGDVGQDVLVDVAFIIIL